jgi:CRP-like cAMP-binding protein
MPAALRASEDSELLLWSRENMFPFFLQNGRLSWELSCLMIRRVQLASEIVEKLAFQPVAGRLARLLVEFSNADSIGPIARSLTLDEMAARIGSTREVVCRFLQRFASEGLIDITRTEFFVKDSDGLEDLARQGKG